MEEHAQWRTRLSVAAFLALGAAVLILPPRPVSPHPQAGRPECPHDWDAKQGQFAELTPIMNVPEFHDCQRFLVPDLNGGLRYDSLYAIFAVASLAGIEGRLDSSAYCAGCMRRIEGEPREPLTRGKQLRDRATTFGIAAARIYAEGNYRPLGIRRMYDCLYLFRADTAWGAIMVPVTSASSDCTRPIDPGIPWGTELQVRRRIAPGAVAADYPAVARWDWDSVHVRQYIGVRCGAAWCEVGAPGFASSPLPQLNPQVAQELGRVGTIKGWYDEQFLSFLDAEGNVTPSRVRGRIFPSPRLDVMRRVDTTASASVSGAFMGWTLAAYLVLDTLPSVGPMPMGIAAMPPSAMVALQQYKTRLDLDVRRDATAPIRPDDLNRLEICHGTLDQCEISGSDRQGLEDCSTDGEWWARIISTLSDTAYLCVTRRGHENLKGRFDVPGTARWRWMASDEGVWDACGQGCCETLGKPGG